MPLGQVGSWVKNPDPVPPLMHTLSDSLIMMISTQLTVYFKLVWSNHLHLIVDFSEYRLILNILQLLKLMKVSKQPIDSSNVMAALLNIGGALCEHSKITFLVRCCKV